MTAKPSFLIAAASLAVAACATTEDPRPVDTGRYESVPEGDLPPLDDMTAVDVDDAPVRGAVTGECGQENYAHYVGQPASIVDATILPDPHRVLPHDAVITMEYRADRLTIRIGADGRVETVACG